ncbi:MAG: lipid-A-disaccharide synthase [Bacteroidetes bacterium]|jgi:lipid-A-disaccharide synthase|nr:lipid-A-disaccharide synthase [Bacteroidota bacterium]
MKYFLIAGEASGELHGSNLMRGIKKYDSQAEFEYFGGSLMQAEGGTLRKHYREMAFMGIWEVLVSLNKIRQNFRDCREALLAYQPDALILIDYAGFNLRMAKFAKARGIKTLYYISPKVWAWKKNRIHKIKQYVDRLFVIFPFEVDYFKERNYKAEFLGNPTFDALERKVDHTLTKEQFIEANQLNDKPLVALLAGSRKQEIDKCLPVMTEAVKAFSNYQFVVAGAPSIEPDYYKPFLDGTDVQLVHDCTYDLLRFSRAAVVTSGTATLETALLNIPQVVMYKTSAFNYYGFKHVVKIPYFSLVNIIARKEVVKELLQIQLVPNIRKELKKLLIDDNYRENMLTEYKSLRDSLGGKGCSERIGKRIVEMLR